MSAWECPNCKAIFMVFGLWGMAECPKCGYKRKRVEEERYVDEKGEG